MSNTAFYTLVLLKCHPNSPGAVHLLYTGISSGQCFSSKWRKSNYCFLHKYLNFLCQKQAENGIFTFNIYAVLCNCSVCEKFRSQTKDNIL